MPQPFEYAAIEPLITRADSVGAVLSCRFTCPVTGRGVDATADLRAAADTMKSRSPWSGLSYTLAHLLGVAQAERAASAPVSSDVREAAAVRAFRSVSSVFRWEREKERWVAGDATDREPTRFEQQLNVHPVRGGEDHETLMRLLVAIAEADNGVSAPESAFLRPFFPTMGPTIEEIQSRPMPDAERLRAIPKGRRESILMICWAAALCDDDLGIEEKALLESLTSDLEVSVERAAELRVFAARYLLDRIVEDVLADFVMTIEEEDRVTLAGIKLGLPLAEIQGVIRRFRERRGLAAGA